MSPCLPKSKQLKLDFKTSCAAAIQLTKHTLFYHAMTPKAVAANTTNTPQLSQLLVAAVWLTPLSPAHEQFVLR